jgi:hypothetical protein
MSRRTAVRFCLACSVTFLAAGPVRAQDAGNGAAPAAPQQTARTVWQRVAVPLRAAGPEATGLDLVLKLRPATATAVAGPDTGGTGYVVQFEFLRPFGTWNAFGRLGFRGSAETGLRPDRQPWHAGFGARRVFEGGGVAGASMEYRQSRMGWAPVRALSVFGGLSAGPWHYQLSLARSAGAPDRETTVGFVLARRF